MKYLSMETVDGEKHGQPSDSDDENCIVRIKNEIGVRFTGLPVLIFNLVVRLILRRFSDWCTANNLYNISVLLLDSPLKRSNDNV